MSPRNSIYLKFLGIQVPVFLLSLALALHIVSGRLVRDAEAELAARVGALVSRTGGLVADTDVAIEADAANRQLALLLTDRAIRCAELTGGGVPERAVAAPRRIGCTGAGHDQTVSVSIQNDEGPVLNVGFSTDEITEVRRSVRTYGGLLGLLGMMLAALAASISFRTVVGEPIGRLLTAIRETTRSGKPVEVSSEASDEIGTVAEAFNAMQRRLTGERSLLEAAHSRLKQQALTDALTGLPNRAGLAQHVEDVLNRAEDASASIAVMLIDLDNFKWVNDTFGHAAGDQLLVEAAARIRASVGDAPHVSRLGGDEFAVVLSAGGARNDSPAIAARIVQAFAQPIDLDGSVGYVSASIGIAIGRMADASAQELLRQADQAMYAAKRDGKRRHHVYDEADLSQDRVKCARLELIERGLREGLFSLSYQPIINLDTMRVAGVEALLRVHAPNGEAGSIEALIRVAEESGNMDRLGGWVLQEVGRHFDELRASCPNPGFYVAVNLSARQLHEGFVHDLRQIMRRHPALASHLMLELTETAAIRRFDLVSELLNEVRSNGVRIAIDDFGTGYSSMSYISRLPIDLIKLDRSYVAAFEPASDGDADGRKRQALVRAAATLGRELGIKLVAEGIENSAVCERMQGLGIDFGQGYGFARPMPKDAAIAWIRAFSLRPEAAVTPSAVA